MNNEFDFTDLGKYTPWSMRRSYAEEWKMVQDVYEQHEALETLEMYLMTLAAIVSNQVQEQHPERPIPSNIFAAAFMYLPKGIQTYYILKKQNKIGYKFSTYYEWFMRQGMLDYPEDRFRKKGKFI